jgi:RES domain-containing protein
VHIQVQRDWRVFNLSEDAVHGFLVSAVPDHPLLAVGVGARLCRLADGTPDGSVHLLSWAQFSEEIRTKNRHFPQTVPDRSVLESVLLGSVERIEQDVTLYRGRVVEPGQVLTAADMGAPPAKRAVGGRANPVGIPYLYLSFSEATCVYETRVANHTQVAVGRFHASRVLVVLNLADIEPPDFFDAEVEAAEAQVRRVLLHRYLSELGDELRKPVSATDQPTDYIPTQYLCELAKSLGLDGVLYSSSLHEPGRNLVLFDVDSATCEEPVRVLQITALHAEWRDC